MVESLVSRSQHPQYKEMGDILARDSSELVRRIGKSLVQFVYLVEQGDEVAHCKAKTHRGDVTQGITATTV